MRIDELGIGFLSPILFFVFFSFFYNLTSPCCSNVFLLLLLTFFGGVFLYDREREDIARLAGVSAAIPRELAGVVKIKRLRVASRR